jgi:CheY-like chemotaxis protein
MTTNPITRASSPTCLRVLVVDDHPDRMNTLCTLLGLWGHEYRTARDGRAALAAAAAFQPEVILTALGRPRLDGGEVARRARHLPGLANTFLVAVTGSSQGTGLRPQEATFDAHLASPFDLNEFRGLLAQPRESAGDVL